MQNFLEMINQILNYLHRKGHRHLLARAIKIIYRFKGFVNTTTTYHSGFKAYEYKVNGITYLSLGPGWAYNFDFLKRALLESYNHFYTPKVGDCVIDLGAGLGEETVVYSMLVGEEGQVHALEANPKTHSGLRYMCEQNNFKRTIPHNLAIYKIDGEVTIEDDEENYLKNTIQTTSSLSNHRVRAVTLDTLVNENKIAKIDFLKANVEGAEQYLIEGMRHSIKLVRNVCISCHDFRHIYHSHGEFYMTKQKVRLFLEANGFQIIDRDTDNRVVADFIYARNTKLVLN